MVLNIGNMRSYVTIQVSTRISDGQGGWDITWADTYYQWFKATPLSASRELEEGGIKYRKAVEFRGWYRDDYGSDLYNISGAYRLKWNNEYYTIYSVLPDETNTFITILAYV